MSKHTAGPWLVRNLPSNNRYVGPANDGGAPNVAIIPKRINRSADEQDANARLIAAAPELLEALLRIAVLHPDKDSDEGYNEWGEADCFKQAQDIARAAISKATGEAK